MPMSYQIAILGPSAATHKGALKRRLRKRLRELGASLPDVVKFLDASSTPHRDIKAPVVAVFFGGASTSTEDLSAVNSLLTSSSVIIPIVEDITKFNNSVPSELQKINGLELKSSDKNMDQITNLVLENLGLLRRTRRLFISYRRTDSSAVALQLRHELDAHGYDVFLDTHSVPKGDDFQEVLWHRMADSDVVVLLDTPGFLESRWTKEELAQAEAMTIGMVQIVWPGHKPAPYTDLCERIYLETSDFAGSDLKQSVLEKIAIAVEQLRARSLAARHNNLVREFCDAAASVNVHAVVQPERFILASLPSGQNVAAIPAVGVPDALRYHEASQRFPVGGAHASEAILIYDHRGLRPNWGDFLNWLDEFLPVKTMRVTSAAARLMKP